MPDGYVVAAVYLVLINIVAACLTVWDKRRAQKKRVACAGAHAAIGGDFGRFPGHVRRDEKDSP